MEEDFLKELGYLSVATRLKRVSDRMIHSGRAMYKTLDIDIEPNWYMVFRLLQKHESLSVTAVAQKLQFSHPSIISIVNKMIKSGYLQSKKCEEDGRKQLLQLTDKAEKALPQFEKIWAAGIVGMEKMMEDLNFLTILEQIESRLAQADFQKRTLEELKR